MLQKRDSLGVDDPEVIQVDFSTHAESVWPSVGSALEEVRSCTLTHVVQPCRSRVPSTSSAALGAQVPTAVVAPIKRELPDQVPLVAGAQTLAGATMSAVAEKYSLPPFETLVTSHRSPDMAAPSPATTTDKRPMQQSTALAVGVPSSVSVGVPSSTVGTSVSPETIVRLPGIHQLFQTTSGQPVAGTGNCLSAVNDEAMRYTWSQSQPLGVGASTPNGRQSLSQQQHQQHHHLVQFFAKTEDHLLPGHNLPPPPPYPGLPGPGSGRPYLAYGGPRNTVGEHASFQSVLSSSSARR